MSRRHTRSDELHRPLDPRDALVASRQSDDFEQARGPVDMEVSRGRGGDAYTNRCGHGVYKYVIQFERLFVHRRGAAFGIRPRL